MRQRPRLLRFAGLIPIFAGILLLFYEPGAITISWETASELNTRGFNLFRAEGSPDAPFEQVNEGLIPAQGGAVTGASYHVVDERALGGRTYYYQIEEIEWNGARTRYPETVQVRSKLPRIWFTLEGVALILVGAILSYAMTQNIGGRGQQGRR